MCITMYSYCPNTNIVTKNFTHCIHSQLEVQMDPIIGEGRGQGH